MIAWLKGMMLYVMNDCKWTKQIQDYMEWSLRYDLWVKMRIFGGMLDAAFNDEEKATRRGPMNMLTMLKDEFTMEDLILVRRQLGKSVDTTSVKKQLSEYLSGLQGFCFVLYLGLVYVFMSSTMAQTYIIIITTRGE